MSATDDSDFRQGLPWSETAASSPSDLPRGSDLAETIATRSGVIDYLIGRSHGAAADPQYAAQALSDLGLGSIDVVEILLVMTIERRLSVHHVVDVLMQGDEAERRCGQLLKRVLSLAVAFDPWQRYQVIRTGAAGGCLELSPLPPALDSVAALEAYFAVVEQACRQE